MCAISSISNMIAKEVISSGLSNLEEKALGSRRG